MLQSSLYRLQRQSGAQWVGLMLCARLYSGDLGANRREFGRFSGGVIFLVVSERSICNCFHDISDGFWTLPTVCDRKSSLLRGFHRISIVHHSRSGFAAVKSGTMNTGLVHWSAVVSSVRMHRDSLGTGVAAKFQGV